MALLSGCSGARKRPDYDRDVTPHATTGRYSYLLKKLDHYKLLFSNIRAETTPLSQFSGQALLSFVSVTTTPGGVAVLIAGFCSIHKKFFNLEQRWIIGDKSTSDIKRRVTHFF